MVQLFPKTTPVANVPRMGLAGEENGRAILGTVPVEADGSARFRLPARTKVLFQALPAVMSLCVQRRRLAVKRGMPKCKLM